MSERRNTGVVRSALVAIAGLLLALVLAAPSGAQEDYPDGGNDQPPAVQGETFEPAGAPGGASDPGTSFAATGAYIALMVAAGVVLVMAGVWLQRRSKALDSPDG